MFNIYSYKQGLQDINKMKHKSSYSSNILIKTKGDYSDSLHYGKGDLVRGFLGGFSLGGIRYSAPDPDIAS